jgi:uncharacterized protein YdeI (YjbR/CyaY-like superfamily)
MEGTKDTNKNPLKHSTKSSGEQRMTEELYLADRNSWRSWLSKNHASMKGVWLVYFKKHTCKPSISYEDSVQEALCFGWIDGIIKRLDDERCARKFMPRRNGSKWSQSNKNRAEKMIQTGKMTEAGMIKIREAKENGEWFRSSNKRKEALIPKFMQDVLANNPKASACFDGLADSYKRQYILWISNAKKDETKQKRLAEALKLLEQNRKLGLK